MLLLNGCDDGNLTLETINFGKAATKSCPSNNIIYRLNEKEALLLEIPKTVFENEPTTDPKSPKIINIDNSTYRLVYRFYDGIVTTNNICNTIPPAKPYVIDQWTASSGKIEIVTTAIKTTDATNNSSRITGYNHNIAFKDIIFDKEDGTKINKDTLSFGNKITELTNKLPFGFLEEVKQCVTSKQLYNYINSEALTIDNIDSGLIENSETPLNTPRTAIISSVKNKLTYRLHGGLLSSSYFCNTTAPTIPSIIEEWDAVDGGIIEVTTIKNGNSSFKHNIILKNVVLKKGNSNFKLGNNFIYGELITLI